MTDNVLHEYEHFQREVLRRRPRTVGNYMPEVADFLRYLGIRDFTVASVAQRLAQVDQPTLLTYLCRPSMSGKAIGAVTWNLRLAAVRSLYAYLCRIEVLTMNPALKIDRQRTFERATVPLTLDELIRLVESVRDNSSPLYRERNVAIVQVLIHCSLRVHEVVGLAVDQVDFDHHLLLDVRRKGGKALASAMNDVVAEALQACIAAREGFHPSEAELSLFLSDRGTGLSIRTVQEAVKLHGRLAGIRQPVTPHLLRHSSATQLAALGTPLRVVQDICGHSSISTTTRYVHPANDDRKRAVDALAAIWRRQRGLTTDVEVDDASRPI